MSPWAEHALVVGGLGMVHSQGTASSRSGKSELRFAVTMNGGVSLAVYMGGVTHEMNLISKAQLPGVGQGGFGAASGRPQSDPYGRLLDLLDYTPPVIDVLTGTSAGGINAAALAVAQANRSGDIGGLKPLWLADAQIESMLRDPFRSGAPSLLKGDEYFLPLLQRAFRQMTSEDVYKRSNLDLELVLTTTLLRPYIQRSPDEFNTTIVEREFAGLFTFRGLAGSSDDEVDDFAETRIGETARALALAARASAGFPVAFEPTFIPVRDASAPADRPDMARYANWAEDPSVTTASRYGVDGGVLNNTPTLPALSALKRRRANDKFIRRVLILVHPHAEDSASVREEPDRFSQPPTLVETIQRIAQAATSVGSRAYVREIKEHNATAVRWRDSRALTVAQFKDWNDLCQFLDRSQPAWRLYRAMRMERNSVFMAEAVSRDGDVPTPQLKAEALQFLREQDRVTGGLPYIPKDPPTESVSPVVDGWPWGIALATGLASHLAQLLRGLDQELEGDSRADEVREVVAAVWSDTVNLQSEMDRHGGELETRARNAANEVPDLQERFLAYLSTYRQELTPGSGTVDTFGHKVASCVNAVVTRFYDDVLRKLPAGVLDDGSNPLGGMLLRSAGSATDLTQRLLGIEVVSYLLSETSASESSSGDRFIELIQLNARTPQHFAERFSADDKLAGMALGRFGAFFKQAWRANDWIWGRLDAAKILMLILLTPATVESRARRRGLTPDATDEQRRAVARELVVEIGHCAFESEEVFTGLISSHLSGLFNQATDEVAGVLSGVKSGQLEHLASLAAYGPQITIASDEIPSLRAAVVDDRRRGAVGVRADRLLDQLDGLRAVTGDTSAPPGYRQLIAFRDAAIGSEQISEQIPSDALIRTASTAAATSVSMLTSPASGLELARGLIMGLRGAVALPYWVITGLTQRGQLARIAAATTLALGVSLVTVSLIAPLHGVLAGLLPVLGFGSLLAIAVYGAMRTRSVVHVAALLGLLIPLVMLGLAQVERDQDSAVPPKSPAGGLDSTPAMGWFAVGCVAAVVVGTVVIANLSAPIHSPLSAGFAGLRRSGRLLARFWKQLLGAVLPGAIGAWLIAAAVQRSVNHPRWFREWITSLAGESGYRLINRLGAGFPFCAAFYLATIAVGMATATVISRQLRPYNRTTFTFNRTRRARLSDPTGLAIAWTAIYGALYVGLTWVLVKVTSPTPRGWPPAAAWMALGLALTFSLFVGPLLWVRFQARLVERLAVRMGTEDDFPSPYGTRSPLIEALAALDADHAYLFNRSGELSRAGHRIARRARRRWNDNRNDSVSK